MKAEVLKEYILVDFPWVKDLLVYKKLLKAYSGYIKSFLELNINNRRLL